MRKAPSYAPHWIAAAALFTGGAIAFSATFLPLGQAAYFATAHDPATTVAEIPAQDLITTIQFNARYPQESSIGGTCFWGIALWGAPLILATIGLTLLIARRWTPRPRMWIVSLILLLLVLLLGAGYVIVSSAFYLTPFFGRQGAVRTLEYGAAISLLGYFVTLVGVIWLAFQRTRRARADSN